MHEEKWMRRTPAIISIIAWFLVSAMASTFSDTDTTHIRRKWLDRRYASASSAEMLDIYLPDSGHGPFPVILQIHGGAFMEGDKRDGQLSPVLHALGRGYAIVAINYRLSGEAHFPAAIQDVKAALRWYVRMPRRTASMRPGSPRGATQPVPTSRCWPPFPQVSSRLPTNALETRECLTQSRRPCHPRRPGFRRVTLSGCSDGAGRCSGGIRESCHVPHARCSSSASPGRNEGSDRSRRTNQELRRRGGQGTGARESHAQAAGRSRPREDRHSNRPTTSGSSSTGWTGS